MKRTMPPVMRSHPSAAHWLLLAFLLACPHSPGSALSARERGPHSPPQSPRVAEYRDLGSRLRVAGFSSMQAYTMLEDLTRRSGRRLSGSPGADTAVAVARAMMERLGLDSVWLEPVTVPHWVRGNLESATISGETITPTRLDVCALGGSIGTPPDGVMAQVVEVHSFEELRALGGGARGKIVFYNRPMDPTVMETFDAYGGAVNQRSAGAMEGSRAGAVAVIVRSLTLASDDVPHTGSVGYADTLAKIPAAAVSTRGADLLSRLLKREPALTLHLTLSARRLPDVSSANVVGEIRGVERPDEIVVVGGHLDSWDKGTGAHDDGSGCVQAIEVLNLFKKLGLRPKRTVRAVMFMNEENGLRGGRAYAANPARASERHVAMIESDRGGFVPRGFTFETDSALFERSKVWIPCFEPLMAAGWSKGGSGADISPLVGKGVPGVGLIVESHRYFDYHHSDNDTIDKVNPRELELGAVVVALLCYIIAQEGL